MERRQATKAGYTPAVVARGVACDMGHMPLDAEVQVA